jgi:antitoxin component of MazEF toxin-antitoxin module
MVVKHLIQHGNSKAIVIDKAILEAAGLDENALFQIVVDPNCGITIQSVKPMNDTLFKNSLDKVMKKHGKMFKRLADR